MSQTVFQNAMYRLLRVDMSIPGWWSVARKRSGEEINCDTRRITCFTGSQSLKYIDDGDSLKALLLDAICFACNMWRDATPRSSSIFSTAAVSTEISVCTSFGRARLLVVCNSS